MLGLDDWWLEVHGGEKRYLKLEFLDLGLQGCDIGHDDWIKRE